MQETYHEFFGRKRTKIIPQKTNTSRHNFVTCGGNKGKLESQVIQTDGHLGLSPQWTGTNT